MVVASRFGWLFVAAGLIGLIIGLIMTRHNWRFQEQREYERNHASRYADGKVVPVGGRHLKRVK